MIRGQKYFYDGSSVISGIINPNNLLDLTPCLDLWDGGNNTDRITEYDRNAITVFLDSRTLYKDGGWNTLCLPFDLSQEQVATMLGSDATLMGLDVNGTYDGHSTGLEGNTLYLYFKKATTITAGKPYIIKWTEGSNLVEPIFSNITLIGAAPTAVTFSGGRFAGTYDSVTYPAGTAHKDVLFLGGNNKLYYPDGTKATTIGTFRAYFEVANGAQIKEFKLNFDGEDDVDGIDRPTPDPSL